MGHRSYILYERDDGLFNVHYSHWGAHDLELVHKITELTPLGGDSNEPEFLGAFTAMLDSATQESGLELSGAVTEAQEPTAVTPEPEMVGVTIRDAMNPGFHCEAMFIVDRDFDVTGYHCLHSDEGMLLYEPRWVEDDPCSLGYDRGYFRGLRDALPHDEAVDRFLGKIEDSLSKTVLAKSPAVTDRRLLEFPGAFVKMRGLTRKGYTPEMREIPEDSYMVATGVIDPPSWALPDRYEIETTDGVWKPG